MAKEPRKAFLLRLSPELWQELEGWAQADMRSVNSQIEYVLRQAVIARRKRPRSPPDDESAE